LKIYRLDIAKIEGEILYSPVYETEIDDIEFLNRIFQNSSIALFAIIAESKLVCLSKSQELLTAFSSGLNLQYRINRNWEELFLIQNDILGMNHVFNETL
jgi:hypothetical protein